jgi:uncharacterized protein (TIGR02444 family)
VSREPDDHGDALWSWSLDIYRRDGVPASCLALQDEHGFDVNVALACVWAALRGWRLDSVDVAGLLDATVIARRRVVELRLVRKDAKGDDDAREFYEALKRAELVGEKVVQRGLERWMTQNPRPAEGTSRQRAEHSLRSYGQMLSPRPATWEAVASFLDRLGIEP